MIASEGDESGEDNFCIYETSRIRMRESRKSLCSKVAEVSCYAVQFNREEISNKGRSSHEICNIALECETLLKEER